MSYSSYNVSLLTAQPEEVEFLIVVCNEIECETTIEHHLKGGKEVQLVNNCPVTLGEFGGQQVAVAYIDMGGDSLHELVDILLALRKVDKIIALGIGYGADPEKQQLCDVLVSQRIECGPNFRIGKDHALTRGPAVIVDGQLNHIFGKKMYLWSNNSVNGFLIPAPPADKPRYAQVHLGTIISAPNLVDNLPLKRNILAAYKDKKVVGGVMEAWALHKAAKRVEDIERRGEGSKRHIGVTVIKGVADYGDGSKNKTFQPLAAEAANHYAEFQLRKVSNPWACCVCTCTVCGLVLAIL